MKEDDTGFGGNHKMIQDRNRILDKMLERLFGALANGPTSSCSSSGHTALVLCSHVSNRFDFDFQKTLVEGKQHFSDP